jgi:hypothetical protein
MCDVLGGIMNIHDSTEQAYKNGYEAGVREFAERLKICLYDKPSLFTQQRYIVNSEVDTLVEEMTEDEGK